MAYVKVKKKKKRKRKPKIVCLICDKKLTQETMYYSGEFDEHFCEADYNGGIPGAFGEDDESGFANRLGDS